MTQYLLSIYQPDGPPPATVDLERIMRDVGTLNAEMQAAGAWVFAGGLHDAGSATVLRPGGREVLVVDGPFVEGREHLGGFTVIRAADLDAALEWGRKLALATTLPVEVRPFRH
ncbi:MAG: YciI family protein [Vicinamibacterales bacterium]